MNTYFSNIKYAKWATALQQQALHVFPPAIIFHHSKQDKEESEGSDKEEYLKIDVPLDTTNNEDTDTTEWEVPTFQDGSAKEWIK